MKIASWNVNSLKVRLPQVLAWLEEAQPDVLGIQETKLADEVFPRAAFEEAGWHVVFSGQKTYNGVAIVARSEPTDIVTDIPGLDDPQRRILGATIDGVRIYNLYVPNGSEVGSEKFAYKLDWLEHMTAHLATEHARHDQMVVVGDFNITPADADVYDPVALAGDIHCSEPERSALERLCGQGFIDTFHLFEQPERSFSWWDYRANAFRRDLGLRIDLILASAPLTPACRSCAIDVGPRRNERPSDHAPVIADFAT
jgi:exodeoxyribonuclease-3